MISHIASFCFGASIALVFVMLRMTRQKPPGITKFARMTRAENPVEIASATEVKRRMYRDGLVDVQAQEVGGIRYEHLGMTGEEV